jgi:hypothetical protein
VRRPSAVRITAAALCTAAALGLTACDSLLDDPGAQGPFAGLTGPEIINKAVATTRAATSVRMTVTTESADGPVQVFVTTDTRGECTGTFSMGAAGTMELVRTDGTVYTKSDEAMLRGAATAGSPGKDADIKRLTGRWVTARPGDRRTAESLRYCDTKGFLDRLAAKSETARPQKEATVAGTPSLTLTGKAGTPAGEKWTASVATEGKAYVLKMRIADGVEDTEKPLTVEFSEFGEPVTAKKPALR